MRVTGRIKVAASIAGLCLLAGVASAGPAVRHRVIIRAAKPYDAIERKVQALGGDVLLRFKNVDAIVASIPDARYAELAALLGPGKASKDLLIAAPRPIDTAAHGRHLGLAQMQASVAQALDAETLIARPADYVSTNALIGADELFADGNLGQDVVVAIIDSGTANSPAVPALSLTGRVIGGENLVPSDKDPVTSATSRNNGAHGTWVGTVIAGNAVFGYKNTGQFVPALKLEMPSAIQGDCPDPPEVATCAVPMLGVAPGAKLYALKVFPSTGGSAPESRVMAAMDRAITLRRNFNLGMSTAPVSGDGTEDNPYQYEALNIQVVNMSLGGSTVFAGRDLEDQLTTQMLKVGITLVASAGNDGFAAMTGGSPGSGFGSLTVGAASEPAHERLVADLFLCGLGCGAFYRPFDALQTADFSSRGPTADGRFDPDITANGAWLWAQGTCEGNPGCSSAPLSFVSGTSFSAPTAAGAAALLRHAAPWATAAQIRNALIAGANPRLLADGSKRIDQGRGFLDVPAALAKLRSGRVSSMIERSFPTTVVQWNIGALGFRPVNFRGDTFSTHVPRLKPGEVAQFFVPADMWTDQFVVKFSNITPELPPEQQNPFFGDDLLVRIADAPTSTWSSPCALSSAGTCEAYINSDQAITIDKPQTGLVRVAVQGDWTNAGKVSADLVIERTRNGQGRPTAIGRVQQDDLIPVQVEIPAGTTQAVFELAWVGNWGRYPTNDLDMYLLDPNTGSEPNDEGATAASPERVVIDNPLAGVWTVQVQGFSVQSLHGDPERATDEYALRVTADGQRLPAVQTH